MSETTITAEPATIATTTAVVFLGRTPCVHKRKYWLCWWIGMTFGPLLMAMFLPKRLEFGVEEGRGKHPRFRWITFEY